MATHSSIPAWRIPWTEEPGELWCIGSQRGRHEWVTTLSLSRTIIVVQSLSWILFVSPWIVACQAFLSFSISRSLLKFMSIELMMPSNHLILCCPLLLLLSIFPSIRLFSNEWAHRIIFLHKSYHKCEMSTHLQAHPHSGWRRLEKNVSPWDHLRMWPTPLSHIGRALEQKHYFL